MKKISIVIAISLVSGCKSEPPTIVESFLEYIDGYTVGFQMPPTDNFPGGTQKKQYFEDGTLIVMSPGILPGPTCFPGMWEIRNGQLCEKTRTARYEGRDSEGMDIWDMTNWDREFCANVAESNGVFSIPTRGAFVWRTDEQLTCEPK